MDKSAVQQSDVLLEKIHAGSAGGYVLSRQQLIPEGRYAHVNIPGNYLKLMAVSTIAYQIATFATSRGMDHNGSVVRSQHLYNHIVRLRARKPNSIMKTRISYHCTRDP